MPDRQTQLEELLAHQQRLLDDLNEVVTSLRADLDAATLEQRRLRKTVDRLLQHYEAADDSAGEKPPHY